METPLCLISFETKDLLVINRERRFSLFVKIFIVSMFIAVFACGIVQWWPTVFFALPILAFLVACMKPNFQQARRISFDKPGNLVTIGRPLPGIGRVSTFPLSGIKELCLQFRANNLRAVITLVMQDGTEEIIFMDPYSFSPFERGNSIAGCISPDLGNDELLRIARFIGVPLRKILFSDQPEGELPRNQKIFAPVEEVSDLAEES